MEDWTQIISTKNLQPHEVDVVIYHNPCPDGTASGFVAWKYFKENYPGKDVKYYPMSIGANPPVGLDGKNVLICDYSYRKDVLVKLLKVVNKLLIIDHHQSAQKDLVDIDDCNKIFEMKNSGAMLTWLYFFPLVKPPLLIEYVQDRDIWTKLLPNTDDFQSWFYTLELKFEEYEKYLDEQLLLHMIDTRGKAFRELNEFYIRQAVEYAVPKFCKIKDNYYFVAYVNSTVCGSDIGNKLMSKYPMIDFACVYSLNESSSSTNFSLRSTNKHVDVGTLAFSLSGGGHRNAAGHKVQSITTKLPGITYDNGELYKELKNIYYDNITINDKEYNMVYFTSTTNKTKLGTYFLQDKYSFKENVDVYSPPPDNKFLETNIITKTVQVCQDISIKLDKTYPEFVHMALVFSINPTNNTTHFSVVFHPTITADEKTNIYNYFGCKRETKYGLTYNGMHTVVPKNIDVVVWESKNDDDIDW